MSEGLSISSPKIHHDSESKLGLQVEELEHSISDEYI